MELGIEHVEKFLWQSFVLS